MSSQPAFLGNDDGVRSGKVRDIYTFGHHLLLVSSDRISAFDWVLPTPIPDKGRVLSRTSEFWFRELGDQFPHHFVTSDLDEIRRIEPRIDFGADEAYYQGRCALVKSTTVIPFECVVRGYLAGSGLKEYRQSGKVCGIELPPGLLDSSQLPKPIFTPATKAETGHDENISFAQMKGSLQTDERFRNIDRLAELLAEESIELYRRGAAYALKRGFIVADTKFEWGLLEGQPILIDEMLTPDSSRFWPADQYEPGHSQVPFDKQFVRDWLEKSDWDKNSPPPALPPNVVTQTRAKYIEAYERLTGHSWETSS